MTTENLEIKLKADMLNIYTLLQKEIKYTARRYKGKLDKPDTIAKDYAIALIHKEVKEDGNPDGFKKLKEAKRLDLCVEALVVRKKEYHSFIGEENIKKAKDKLEKHGYTPDNPA